MVHSLIKIEEGFVLFCFWVSVCMLVLRYFFTGFFFFNYSFCKGFIIVKDL